MLGAPLPLKKEKNVDPESATAVGKTRWTLIDFAVIFAGNPVLCDDNTKTITKAMELKYSAEVSGTAKCVPVTNDIKSNLTDTDTSAITVIVT